MLGHGCVGLLTSMSDDEVKAGNLGWDLHCRCCVRTVLSYVDLLIVRVPAPNGLDVVGLA